jgi:branched-chain amino acid transport system substrate-binding protein
VPLAVWAANQKLKTVFNLIADYATGIQSGAVFADAFTARGGKMAGDLRFPLTSTEFSAYVQRIKDSKADAMFAFVPAGPPSIAFFQASKAAQLRASGIKMIFNPTTVDDLSLAAIGDEALGAISCSQYAWTHKSALNAAFVAAFRRAATGGVQNPDFMSEAAFNVMTAIDRVVAAQTGPLDLDKTLATLKGLQIEGPRGPIQLDAKTREPIENMYIRRVERVNGVLASVEFDTIPRVPGEYK